MKKLSLSLAVLNFSCGFGFVLKTPLSRPAPATSTLTSATKLQSTTTSSSNVFVLSYDGVVADTTEWRSNLAIDVALDTWPELRDYDSLKSYDSDEQNRSWLVNKIGALLPVTLSGKDGIMGCDAVLLTRLLMEEQLLDQGRSVGCKGKYGSKYHPSSSSASDQDEDAYGKRDLRSRQGSRPLTVGEISSNWNEGACLKDTVRIKYNVDRQDPIPVIQRGITKYLEDIDSRPLPIMNPSISDAVIDCDCPVYILVGDESHVSSAIASMSELPLSIQSMDWSDDNVSSLRNNQHDGVTVIPPNEGHGGHEKILESILQSLDSDSSMHVVHSDIRTLQKAKVLFGDNRPRTVGAFGKSSRQDVELKLSLPIVGSGPQQQNTAEMDPWLNVIEEFDLVETMTARIISQ